MTQPIALALQLVLAIGAPALIALLTPRRWRLWAIMAWALAPLLVGLAMGASEIVSGKASPADLDKLVFGLMLIGSVLLVPWLIACGAGFALGAMLRGRRPPMVATAKPAPSPPAEAAAQTAPMAAPPIANWPPVDDGGPSLSPPSGWRPVHVGFDHDDVTIGGLPVWSLDWRQESAARVMLAHPAHPAQQHAFTVYSVDDGARATRFAAAELSNSVWGFYVWVVEADAAVGGSADGSLRYEHDLGPYEEGHFESAAPTARLYDAGTEVLLFDGAAWPSSRIVPQADGSLLLSLTCGELQTLFCIDPAASRFRDLSEADRARPLFELAGVAAAGRAGCDDPANTYLGRRIAPDGSLKVELQSVEWSNTHWVRSPRVIETASGRVLLDLWGADWDAWPTFPRRGTVRLSMRRYHFGGGGEVEIELRPERYILFEGEGITAGPLSDLLAALEAAAGRSAAAAPPRGTIGPARPTARNWLVALLILVGALAATAVATLVTLRLQGPPPAQTLDVIPPMSPLASGPR